MRLWMVFTAALLLTSMLLMRMYLIIKKDLKNAPAEGNRMD